MKSWGFVSLPTGIHLVVSGQLVEVSFSVSMSPRGVIVVVGSVYSLSDPLLKFFLGSCGSWGRLPVVPLKKPLVLY